MVGQKEYVVESEREELCHSSLDDHVIEYWLPHLGNRDRVFLTGLL